MAIYCNTIPKDYIKSRVNIVEYITNHYPNITLKKSGNVHLGLCPFHDEDSPSFAVWEGTCTYKCFGCNKQGDIFDFVEEMENMNFKEACKVVAQNVGVEYTLTPPNPAHEQYKDFMNENSRRYWYELYSNAEVLNYIREVRGITDESIAEFRIGLVPQQEYKVRADMGGISGRLAFPILEHKDISECKCVAMGYRTLKDEKPKYLNDKNKDDPQSPLYGVYIKGNFLYGYPQAYREVRKKGYVIITEGYLDVVSLHQSGIKNSMAPLGTALTDAQMEVLKTLTNNIVLFLDGDNAGVTNMERVLPMLLQKGFNVKIVVTEGGKDAGDICFNNKFDNVAVSTYISNKATNAIQYMIDKIACEYEKIIVDVRRNALTNGMNLLANVTNEVDKDLFKSLLYKKIDL